jgi:hypothetical protein
MWHHVAMLRGKAASLLEAEALRRYEKRDRASTSLLENAVAVIDSSQERRNRRRYPCQSFSMFQEKRVPTRNLMV